MIEIEIRQTNVPDRPHILAALRVQDDGGCTMTGDLHFFTDPDLPVRDLVTGERLHFADDPERWARNLGTALRSGYLVPVITIDRPHR